MAEKEVKEIKEHIEFHKKITEYERKKTEEKVAKFERENE